MATLDLTADQQAKVKAIFASHSDEGQAFRSQMKADRDALKAAASADRPRSRRRGRRVPQGPRERRGGRREDEGRASAEIDAVLTPEQRAKLEGWVAAHRQQRRAMRGASSARFRRTDESLYSQPERLKAR